MLRFLGRGSGFSAEHNSAVFMRGDSLVLIDCSLTAFIKLRFMDLSQFGEVRKMIVLVTHTHSDHVSGITMLIHFATFVWHIPVEVIAPSDVVKEQLYYLFKNLDGCSEEVYKLYTVDETRYDWLKQSILTEHVPELAGRCFGYLLELDGKRVVYTGDTRSLDSFTPFLKSNEGTAEEVYLYTECASIDSGVHVHVQYLLKYVDFFKENNVKVYLMHLDNEEAILEAVKGTGFELAPLM